MSGSVRGAGGARGVERLGEVEATELKRDAAGAGGEGGAPVTRDKARAEASALSYQLAIQARLLDAEERRAFTPARFPVKVTPEELPPTGLAEPPEMSPAAIEKGLSSKKLDERALAMMALQGLASRDPAAAAAIIAKLPPERAVTVGGTIHGNLTLSNPVGAEMFLIQLSMKVPLPFGTGPNDIPQLPEPPKLKTAEIEKGLASGKGYEYVAAMNEIRTLAEKDPAAAVAILNKLPAERSLEIAKWAHAKLTGPEWGAAEYFLSVAAKDPKFAGRWAGELAKGLKDGGAPAVDLRMPGVKDPEAAVTLLLQNHVGNPKATPAFMAAMHETGGDESLTLTLHALAKHGATPTALAFLQGLKGKECDNFLARVLANKDGKLGEERGQVQRAIGNMLMKLPLVESDPKAWADVATGVTATLEEAVRGNPAAKKELKSWLSQVIQPQWADPAMVGTLRGDDTTTSQTWKSRMREVEAARDTFTALKKEYEEITSKYDGSELEAALSNFAHKFEQASHKFNVNGEASGGIALPTRFLKDIDFKGGISFNHEGGEQSGSGNSMSASGKFQKQRAENIRKFDAAIAELRQYERTHSVNIDQIGATHDHNTRPNAQIMAVKAALNNLARQM